MSIVPPATPTYIDAVTGLLNIPGQPIASGTVGYSVDGVATATASLLSGLRFAMLTLSLGGGEEPPVAHRALRKHGIHTQLSSTGECLSAAGI